MEHHVTRYQRLVRIILFQCQSNLIQNSIPVLVRAQSLQGSGPSRYSVLINKCWNCFAPVLLKINSTAIELFCALSISAGIVFQFGRAWKRIFADCEFVNFVIHSF